MELQLDGRNRLVEKEGKSVRLTTLMLPQVFLVDSAAASKATETLLQEAQQRGLLSVKGELLSELHPLNDNDARADRSPTSKVAEAMITACRVMKGGWFRLTEAERREEVARDMKTLQNLISRGLVSRDVVGDYEEAQGLGGILNVTKVDPMVYTVDVRCLIARDVMRLRTRLIRSGTIEIDMVRYLVRTSDAPPGVNWKDLTASAATQKK